MVRTAPAGFVRVLKHVSINDFAPEQDIALLVPSTCDFVQGQRKFGGIAALNLSSADSPPFLNNHSFGRFHRGPASAPEAGHNVQFFDDCGRLAVVFESKFDKRLRVFQLLLESNNPRFNFKGEEKIGALDATQVFGGFDSFPIRDTRLACLDCSDLPTCLDLAFARSSQFVSREPKCSGEGPYDQCEESRDRFPILLKKLASAGFSPSQRREDLGNTFFRLMIGAFIVGLVHALLKRIGKPNNKRRSNYTYKGDSQ